MSWAWRLTSPPVSPRRLRRAVARQFRVIYRKNPVSENRYTLDHTANLFVIDRDGRLDTIVPFGFPAAHIENLLRGLLSPRE